MKDNKTILIPNLYDFKSFYRLSLAYKRKKSYFILFKQNLLNFGHLKLFFFSNKSQFKGFQMILLSFRSLKDEKIKIKISFP